MNVQEINFELHIGRRAFGNCVKHKEPVYFCLYFQPNFAAVIIYWVHIFQRSIITHHFRALNFIVPSVSFPLLKYSHLACNYYQVQEICGLSVVLAFNGITFNHVWWKSVIRFKSWKWNRYKHKQRHFSFIREFVHFSEDIICLGRFVSEWVRVEVMKKSKRKMACCGEV